LARLNEINLLPEHYKSAALKKAIKERNEEENDSMPPIKYERWIT